MGFCSKLPIQSKDIDNWGVMGTNLGVWGWGILKHPSDIKLIYNT
jgi:hypothetical protein